MCRAEGTPINQVVEDNSAALMELREKLLGCQQNMYGCWLPMLWAFAIRI